jgi:uncharacterized protein (TIGR00730 family)
MMKRICVFAGSSPGARPEYRAAADALGRALAAREIDLVYGGAHVGLMGAIADAVLAAGRQVIGVIPEGLVAHELAHTGLTELRIVPSMHARKAMMAELSDGFIALPGGWGTLEELFEVLTWSQLRIHAKPCGLLNIAGYFDPLLAFVDRSIEERFVRPEYRRMLTVDDTADALLDRLAAYEPPTVEKWLDRSQLASAENSSVPKP